MRRARVGVSRLLAAGLLYCDDAGRLCVPESRVAEALVELHGNPEDGLDDTVEGLEDAA